VCVQPDTGRTISLFLRPRSRIRPRSMNENGPGGLQGGEWNFSTRRKKKKKKKTRRYSRQRWNLLQRTRRGVASITIAKVKPKGGEFFFKERNVRVLGRGRPRPVAPGGGKAMVFVEGGRLPFPDAFAHHAQLQKAVTGVAVHEKKCRLSIFREEEEHRRVADIVNKGEEEKKTPPCRRTRKKEERRILIVYSLQRKEKV